MTSNLDVRGHISLWGRIGLGLLLSAVVLAGCGESAKTVQPLEIADGTACSLDGMILKDYPGPKAQMHYAQGEPDWFCDTVEMFSIYLKPEQKKRVVALYTQDMGKANWDTPSGNWIDAKSAFYVVGSRRKGSMGPTIASFGAGADADAFTRQYGGKVLRFEQVMPDMVTLDGGVVRDEKM